MVTSKQAQAVAAERSADRAARRAQRRAQRPEKIDPSQAYSIDETCAALDASRSAVYNLISTNKLRTLKLDGRARIPGSEIIRLTSVAA